MARRKLKVLVLCGGKSAEHDVSLVSAHTVVTNLKGRCDFRLGLIDRRGRWFTADAKKLTGKIGHAKALWESAQETSVEELLRGPHDAVFPVLHGPLGEDGTMQGLLEVFGAPYVGCGVLASSAGMDKELTKRLASQAGLPILPYAVLHDPKLALAAGRSLGLPLFVKPARLGSSVGISKVKSWNQLAGAVREAFLYDDKVILEKGIVAREVECAVLGDPWSRDPKDPLRLQASIVGEIVPNAEFYTYASKYLDPKGATLSIPADLPAATAEKVRQISLRAFRVLDCYGMARVDFLLHKRTGQLYFNEANTIPGFTSGSMYPLLWKATGIDTPALLSNLLELALRRHRVRAALKAAP